MISQSSAIHEDFSLELREMRITHENKFDMMDIRMKVSMLNTLMGRSQLSPQ